MIRHLLMVLAISLFFVSTSFADTGAPGLPPGPMPCQTETMRAPQPMHANHPPKEPQVKFSQEQQAQVSAIQNEEKGQLEKLFSQMQEARKVLTTMELSATLNMEEYKKAAQKVASIDVELMVLKAKTNYAIRAILTTEQKNQFIQQGLRQALRPPMPEESGNKEMRPGPEMPRLQHDF